MRFSGKAGMRSNGTDPLRNRKLRQEIDKQPERGTPTRPMKAGEVAAATGIDKAEVDKIIKKLVKEGKVESPKRCYYAAVK